MHLSLDAGIADTDVESLHECVPSDFNLERLAMDTVLMGELKQALKAWKPWAEDGQQFWDTGNRGAATLGQSNTVPLVVPESPTGYEGAVCETRFVGISVLGKLAAGNIYTGTFVKVDGTNGVLDMGRPFTERPTKVKVRIKYKNVAITHAREFPDMLGEPDTCTVWCALGDWDKPYEIRTNPNNRHLSTKKIPV